MRKINLGDNSPPSTTQPKDEVEVKPQPQTITPTEETRQSAVKTLDEQVVDETRQPHNKGNSMNSLFSTPTLILSLAVITAGVATGYGGYHLKTQGSTLRPRPTDLQRIATEGQIQSGDIFGVQDEQTFKDSAQGYLEKDGLDGEGSHKLLRAGGDSQTVYLTSSITDLDKFDGMEIKIWGETFKGQKAGWLMDVGRVEVIEPNGQSPIPE